MIGLWLASAAAVFAQPAPAEHLSAVRPAHEAPIRDTMGRIASLRTRILAARSATLALEAWCAEEGLAADPQIVAFRLAVPDKPLSAEQRGRLAIGPDEPVRYRRVRLVCGEHVLSEADNWYVPSRLTPAMNVVLDTTRTPFGRVVRPLDPVRRTIAERTLAATAQPHADEPLFEIDALLVTGTGEPFCEVTETYLGDALTTGPR